MTVEDEQSNITSYIQRNSTHRILFCLLLSSATVRGCYSREDALTDSVGDESVVKIQLQCNGITLFETAVWEIGKVHNG